MGQTDLHFSTKPLCDCIELTRKIDTECFPEEMWLGQEELTLLIEHGAEATILRHNGTEIGQAITIPEPAVYSILYEVDTLFVASESGVYSYSEAILPAYQNQGYGSLLLHEISVRMRKQGYTTISAHVRTRFGWNRRRSKKLSINNTRLLYDFWDDPHEVVQFQSAYL